MKDLGQACLAFLGSPSDAIERARFIFTSDEVYGRVFPRNISAPQLLLAYLIFQRADAATQEMKRQHSWAPYLRYPLVSCVSRIIHEFTGRRGETNYFPKADSQRLIDSIDDWCPAILQDALPQLVEHVLRTAEEGAGARSLVRQRDWLDEPYANIMRQIGVTLRTEAQIAHAQGVEPATIGLRSTFPYPIKGA